MSKSGAKSDDLVSRGGAGTSTVTKNSMKFEAVDSSPFQIGELVLAFHGCCLYDAKVQVVESCGEGWRYYVHYQGWKKKWDEWLTDDCLLKHTDENVQKKKELLEIYSREKNIKPGRVSQIKTNSSMGVKGRKRKHDIIKKEDIVLSEKLVNIQIPSTLKKQLIDDNESITHFDQLVKLPCTPNVSEILHKYFDYRVTKDGMISESLKVIVNGLRYYFDKALPAYLLYQQERQQYKEVISENSSPSDVYGAEHLLRLFVKLPEMLARLCIEKEAQTELQQNSVEVLRFLQSNQREFFRSSYLMSGEESPTAVRTEE